MTRASRNRDDFCYRHPTTESYVLCQRCGNTICPECQIQAPVGYQCPDCVSGGRPRGIAGLWGARGTSAVKVAGRPQATYALLAVIGTVFVAQVVTRGFITELFLYWPPLTAREPWRMITTMFVHSGSSVFHILFNGYSLFVLGTLVERLVGPGRFVTLFLLSGFGGSVAVLWLSPATAVVGASGAIFGLFGALFVIQRSFGGANAQLLIVLGLNLVMGFIVPGISWQAHIGGLIVGAVVGNIFVRSRESSGIRAETVAIGIVAGALVGLSVLALVL
ncbi:MAG: hypothetical protein RL247_725 [Actinomycetota bacterium]